MAYILGYRPDDDFADRVHFRQMLYRWFVAPWRTQTAKPKQE